MSEIGLPLNNDYSENEKNNYRVYQLISMVVEYLKQSWQTDSLTVYRRLKNCGAINYLTDGYGCLHTQSLEYIIDDIEEMIRLQKGERAVDQ